MIHIDPKLCKACGICGNICPRHIPETTKKDGVKATVVSVERQNICINCGQCAAACPENAIEVDGLDPKGFHPVQSLDLSPDQLLLLMEQRRSVRRYKDKPIPRETLDQIAEAAHRSPPATGKWTTGLIIIDKIETLKKISEIIYPLYEQLDKMMDNPFGRFILRRKMDERKFGALRDFLMPGMKWYIKWYREGKGDEIRRDCPAMMLFHAPIKEASADESCMIAALHAVLMAETLGVGTCINGMIPPVCNRSPDLRALLGLPADREVYACVTMGYPKYAFKRTVPRRLAEVRYLD